MSDCNLFNHDYREEYYGTKCAKCGIFWSSGQAPYEQDSIEELGEAEQEQLYESNGYL